MVTTFIQAKQLNTQNIPVVSFHTCIASTASSHAPRGICNVFDTPICAPGVSYIAVMSLHASGIGWMPHWAFSSSVAMQTQLKHLNCPTWVQAHLHPDHVSSASPSYNNTGRLQSARDQLELDILTGLPIGPVFVIERIVASVVQPLMWLPPVPMSPAPRTRLAVVDNSDDPGFVVKEGRDRRIITPDSQPHAINTDKMATKYDAESVPETMVNVTPFDAMFDWAIVPFLPSVAMARLLCGQSMRRVHQEIVGTTPVCAWRWFVCVLNVPFEAVDRLMWIVRCQNLQNASAAHTDVAAMPDRVQVLVAIATEMLVHAPSHNPMQGTWVDSSTMSEFIRSVHPEMDVGTILQTATLEAARSSKLIPDTFKDQLTGNSETFVALQQRADTLLHRPLITAVNGMLTTTAHAAHEIAFVRCMKLHITSRPTVFMVPCIKSATAALRRHCHETFQLQITEEQLHHTLGMLCNASCAFLCGAAGTGKTTISRLLHYVCSLKCREIILRTQSTDKTKRIWPLFVALAASAAAAARLKQVLATGGTQHVTAHTWHWYMTYANHYRSGTTTTATRQTPKLFDNKVPKVFLLDEAGMQDTHTATRMLQCIMANSAESQVWFVGDGNQLQPVDASGNVFRSVTSSSEDASLPATIVFRLEQVFRAGCGDGILTQQKILGGLLHDLIHPTCSDRNMQRIDWKQLDRCTRHKTDHGCVHSFTAHGVHWYPQCATSPVTLAQTCVDWASQHTKENLSSSLSIVVLCARRFVRHTGVCAINRSIQSRIHASKSRYFRCVKHPDMYTDTPPVVLFTGDIVDYIDNTKHMKLPLVSADGIEPGTLSDIPNGTRGRVLCADEDAVCVQFNTDPEITQTVRIPKNAAQSAFVWPAYALTVHRMQGKEVAHVILCADNAQARMLSRELLYTACTRHRTSLHMFIPRQIIALFLGYSRSDTQVSATFSPATMVADGLLHASGTGNRTIATTQSWNKCSLFWKLYDMI